MLPRHGLAVYGSLVSGPFAEEFIFDPARLDRLDHLDAGNRGGLQLGHIAQPYPGHIDLFVGIVFLERAVDQDRHDADQRQQGTVTDHDEQVKDHHARVQDKRRKRIDHRRCDRRVGLFPHRDVAGLPLGIELHREPQHMPHILTV